MKEHPILFSAPMVRAILDGRKTQTRRIVTKTNSLRNGSPWHKSHPFESHDWDNAWIDGGPSPAGNAGPYLKVPFHEDDTVHRVYPKWSVCDHLWVKETFKPCWSDGSGTAYRADRVDGSPESEGHWKPSIFMTRSRSRIQLEITGVRVERLTSIRGIDAWEEGCPFHPKSEPEPEDVKAWYRELWERINGAGSWAANPWVWVVEFRREEKDQCNHQ